jgi:hypothetical protein
VRLHLPGDNASRDWKSRQEGTHSGDEWTEQEVLEHLAVLSVVARWSDETEPVTAAS